MRNLLTFCLLYLVSACAVESDPTPQELASSTPTLTILVNDVSESTEHVSFDVGAFCQLLRFDALNGGTQLATLLINSAGGKQTPWISKLLKADTVALKGNRYQRARLAQENSNRLDLLDSALNNYMDALKSKVLLPKTDQHSDVNGVFYHLANLAQAYTDKNYKVRIIIFSDLLHDTPNSETLKPIQLPPEVEVLLVGAAAKVDLQYIFPNNKVIAVPAFDTQLFTQNTQ